MSNQIFDRYPGFRPFKESESFLFFGRDQELNELLNSIKAFNLFVLHGKSGLGKTSLINAGLQPLLKKEGFLPIQIPFRITSLSDSKQFNSETISDPFKVIENSFKDHIEDALLAEMKEEEKSLWVYIKALKEKSLVPVLIFDQFEEFFSYPDNSKKIQIMQQISDLVSEKTPSYISELCQTYNQQLNDHIVHFSTPAKVRVLITIKSDRLTHLDEMIPFIPSITNKRFKLNPLSKKQVMEAILLPAGLGDQTGKLFSSFPFIYEENAINDILSVLFSENLNAEENADENNTTSLIDGAESFSDLAQSELESVEVESTQVQILCMNIEKKFIKPVDDKSKLNTGQESHRINKLYPDNKNEFAIHISKDGIVSISTKSNTGIVNEPISSGTGPENHITSETFDGKKGLRLILQNFYEDQLDRLADEFQLAESDMERVRNLIETRMIYKGIRIGLLKEQVMGELIDKDSNIPPNQGRKKIERIIKGLEHLRLIREEQSYLGTTYVISHDALIRPILKSAKAHNEVMERAAYQQYAIFLKKLEATDMEKSEVKSVRDLIEKEMIREGYGIEISDLRIKEVLSGKKNVSEEELFNLIEEGRIFSQKRKPNGSAFYSITNKYLLKHLEVIYKERKENEDVDALVSSNQKFSKQRNIAIVCFVLIGILTIVVALMLSNAEKVNNNYKKIAGALYLTAGKEYYNNYDNFIAFRLFYESKRYSADTGYTDYLRRVPDEVLAGVHIDISPSGTIATLTKDSTLYLWKYVNGSLKLMDTAGGIKNLNAYVVTKDKTKIFFARKGIDSLLRVYDMEKNQFSGYLPIPPGDTTNFIYSEDGNVIVIRENDLRISIYKNSGSKYEKIKNPGIENFEKVLETVLNNTYNKKGKPFKFERQIIELRLSGGGRWLFFVAPSFFWEVDEYYQTQNSEVFFADLHGSGPPISLAKNVNTMILLHNQFSENQNSFNDSAILLYEGNRVTFRNLTSTNIKTNVKQIPDSLIDLYDIRVDVTKKGNLLITFKTDGILDKISIVNPVTMIPFIQIIGEYMYSDESGMIILDSLNHLQKIYYTDFKPRFVKMDTSLQASNYRCLGLNYIGYKTKDDFVIKDMERDSIVFKKPYKQFKSLDYVMQYPFMILSPRLYSPTKYQLFILGQNDYDIPLLYPLLPQQERRKYSITD